MNLLVILKQFILDRVVIDPVTGCWLWQLSTRKKYGRFFRKGKMKSAHVEAYELWRGPVPEGMKVLHNCDTPPCCNPEHLFLGSQGQNVADMDAKGRRRVGVGSRARQAKLVEADIPIIRARLDAGEKHTAIAADYPVSIRAIGCIAAKLTWRHVP